MQVLSRSIEHLRTFVPSGEPLDLIFFSFRALHCRSEITDCQLSILPDNQIGWLKIAMDYMAGMHHVDALEQLVGYVLNQVFWNRIRTLVDPVAQIMPSFLHHDMGFEFRSKNSINLDDVLAFRQFLQDDKFPMKMLGGVIDLLNSYYFGIAFSLLGMKHFSLVDCAESTIRYLLAHLEILHLNLYQQIQVTSLTNMTEQSLIACRTLHKRIFTHPPIQPCVACYVISKGVQIIIYLMLSWPQTLINIHNQDDHEQQCDDTKEIEGMFISSAGRYTITLSRIDKQSISNEAILEQIEEEYGVEKEEFQIQDYHHSQFNLLHANEPNDLVTIFAVGKITLSGASQAFKQNHGITNIQGMRKIIDDGNTIILHFWDAQHHYVLMHEIKYHH